MEKMMIEVEGLVFHYPSGGFRLQMLGLSVCPGEKVALVGPSGSGKTTLLNLLAGILVPEAGSIRIGGVRVDTLNASDRQDWRASRMGLIFQDFALISYLSVLDNILLLYHINPLLTCDGTVRQKAGDLALRLGLDEKLNRYPRHLSQGECQRVAVARALITSPSVILADEPTANLDLENRDTVTDLLTGLTENRESALLAAVHDPELLDRFDRVVDIRGGEET